MKTICTFIISLGVILLFAPWAVEMKDRSRAGARPLSPELQHRKRSFHIVGLSLIAAGGVGLAASFAADRIRKARRPRIADPVFGRLLLEHPEYWRSEPQAFAGGEPPVSFVVRAGRDGPTQFQRDLFLDFKRRYPELREVIANALYDQTWVSQYGPPKQTAVTTPAEVWGFFRLTCIGVHAPGNWCEVMLHYNTDLEALAQQEKEKAFFEEFGGDLEEHEWNVVLCDWQVVEVRKEG